MALPTAYLTTVKNLKPIFEAMQSAQAPEKFTTRFLVSIGFSTSGDRLIIGVLKSLGFLESDGKPKERYFQFLDQTQSEKVLAEGIREAYADLFKIRTDAEKLSNSEVINKSKTLSQGSMSESVLKKFAMTFTSLVKLADFSDPIKHVFPKGDTDDEERVEEKMTEEVAAAAGLEETSFVGRKRGNTANLSGIHYNIQIILPATRDTAIYNAIFKSLKDHLIE